MINKTKTTGALLYRKVAMVLFKLSVVAVSFFALAVFGVSLGNATGSGLAEVSMTAAVVSIVAAAGLVAGSFVCYTISFRTFDPVPVKVESHVPAYRKAGRPLRTTQGRSVR